EEVPALVAVFGTNGSGKSTFVNLASGERLNAGHHLHSRLSNIQSSPTFQIKNRLFQLIESPGVDDPTRMETEILPALARYLADVFEENQKLAGIIYLYPISSVGVGGMSANNFGMFRELCGETTLRNVVIVTNRWEEAPEGVGEAREEELKTMDGFKPALDDGAQLVRHDNTHKSAVAIMEHFISDNPPPLTIGEERQLLDAAAGQVLNHDARPVRRGFFEKIHQQILRVLHMFRPDPNTAEEAQCEQVARGALATDAESHGVPKNIEEVQASEVMRKKAVEEAGEEDGTRTAKHPLRIQTFFQDEQKCRRVLETREEEAQKWLDMMQTLLDSSGIPSETRSTIFKVMLRLSKRSGMHPTCLTMKNVELLNEVPVAGGGFGDVWKGVIAGHTVCLKVVRVYLTSDVQQLVK
ncbi:hypothetical protein AAF712_016423, partial [Marasmius tenuissimus]